MPTRREFDRSKKSCEEAKLACKKSREDAAKKAAEERALVEFLLNRDDQIKAEKEKLDLEIAEWQRQNEANQKTM